MTQDQTHTDGSRIDSTTRRGALAALGGAGLLAALGGSAQADVGGGPASDELAHLLSRFYEGPEDELPEPGVEGRRFLVTDAGGQYEQWSLLRDQGDAWAKVDLNVGSVHAERTRSTQVDRTKTDGRANTRYSNLGTVVDSFEDASDWSAEFGTVEADTDEFFRGSQSLKLDSDTDSRAEARNDTVDLNLVERSFAMAVRVDLDDDDDDSVFPSITATDSEGLGVEFQANYYVQSDARGGPYWIYLDFGFRDWDKGVDLHDIQRIDIDIGEECEMWVDGLVTTENPTPGKLVLGLDDGNVEDYTQMRPILSEYGYQAISYINVGEIGSSGKLTPDQMAELRDDYGWLIGSHGTREHEAFPSLSREESREHLEDQVEWLQDHGHHEGARHLAYPHNQYTEDSYELVHNYHVTGRQRVDWPTGAWASPMLWPGEDADSGLTDRIEQRLEYMAEQGGVGQLYWHAGSPTDSDVREVLDEIQSHEQEGDLQVTTVDDVWESLSKDHHADDRIERAYRPGETFSVSNDTLEIEIPDDVPTDRIDIRIDQLEGDGGDSLGLQISTDSGGTWIAENYDWHRTQAGSESSDGDDSFVQLASDINRFSGRNRLPVTISVANPTDQTETHIEWRGIVERAEPVSGGGTHTDGVEVNTIRIFEFDPADNDPSALGHIQGRIVTEPGDRF